MLKQPKSTLEAFRILQKSVGEPYDGIRGKLPVWVPQQFITAFKEIQSKLLMEQRNNPDRIKQHIQNYTNSLGDHKPEMIDVKIPDKIRGDIDRLWIINYAINLGKPKGLEILLGGKTAENIIPGQEENENLKIGRQKGAKKNKARSTAIKALAKQVNDALLRSPISARWGLDKRAEAISKKFENGTIEIDGKPTSARMVNGKSYSNETIKGWIIGT